MGTRLLGLTGALLFVAGAVFAQDTKSAASDGKVPAAAATQPAAQQVDETKPADVTAAASAKGTTANDPDFVIGKEDVIAVNVWHEPEMSRVMAVRPDGKISLPLIGEFVADGKTPKQLQVELGAKLQSLIKDPDVTVIVQDIRSQKFNVLGEVMRPGMYPLSKPMTVLDAIAVAGGFRDFAKPKKMYILRKGQDGATSKIAVNYTNVIRGSEKNIELQSRDNIVVP